MTRIFKFGGALLKNKEGIERVASILEPHQNDHMVVVVSAIGKTTNALEQLVESKLSNDLLKIEDVFIQIRRNHFELAESVFGNARHGIYDTLNEIFTELNEVLKQDFPDRYFAYDQIVRYGELLSSAIINAYLNDQGIKNELVDAKNLVKTNSNYTSAKVDWNKTSEAINAIVNPLHKENKIVLTQGFIGSDDAGHCTTLGREGSDFTAAIIAHAINADEVTIWKNVPGLMNADPNRFEDSIKLEKISYHEAIELAFYGASVIHPKTIQPVQQKQIPLYVRSFYKPEEKPSLISQDTSEDDQFQKIIVKDQQVLLSIGSRDLTFIAEENLTRIFEVFSKHKIHINLMQHSAVSFSVCFSENTAKLNSLLEELKKDFIIRYNQGLQLITIRFYTDEIIEKLTAGKKIFLEQKSRTTVQLLVR
jgi:aspartate kinase